MFGRRLIGVMVMAGVVGLAGAPVSGAALLDPPQEPGGRYVFTLDYNETPYDPNDLQWNMGDPDSWHWDNDPNLPFKDANDANMVKRLGHGSFIIFYAEQLTTSVGASRMSGGLILYIDDPIPGSPRTWNGRCLLGKADGEIINLDDLDLIVWPDTIEGHIFAGDTRAWDFDLWYQDANEIIPGIDPNWWPDPNNAAEFVDPNFGWEPPWDPNDPNVFDPNFADPNYGTGGDPNFGFDPNYGWWPDPNEEWLYQWAGGDRSQWFEFDSTNPNHWPDPANFPDVNFVPSKGENQWDPNGWGISWGDPNDNPEWRANYWTLPGDPNDPNWTDKWDENSEPNDPNVLRWADLTGGPPISIGRQNSGILFFWAFSVLGAYPPWDPNNWGIDANIEWAGPFGPWTIKIADANYLHPNSPIAGDVQCEVEWKSHVSGDIPIRVLFHFEGVASIPPTPWTLTMQVKQGQLDWLAREPNKPKYEDGRLVILTADESSKTFKKWNIIGPNNTGLVRKVKDPIVYHIMDGDYTIKGVYKCGGGMEPFAGIVLLMLGLGVLIRRLS